VISSETGEKFIYLPLHGLKPKIEEVFLENRTQRPIIPGTDKKEER
jgi:hypothetical protein